MTTRGQGALGECPLTVGAGPGAGREALQVAAERYRLVEPAVPAGAVRNGLLPTEHVAGRGVGGARCAGDGCTDVGELVGVPGFDGVGGFAFAATARAWVARSSAAIASPVSALRVRTASAVLRAVARRSRSWSSRVKAGSLRRGGRLGMKPIGLVE